MRSVNLLAITVLSIMMAGCPGTGTGSPASPLAGDWKTPTPDNAQVVLTFDDDGNLVQLTGTTPDGQSQTRSITGAVTVIDGEMITIRIPTDGGEIVLEGTLSANGNMFTGVLSGEFIVSEELDIRLAQGEVRIDREADDDDNGNANDNSAGGNANDNVDDDNLNDNTDDDDDNVNDNSDDDDNANDNSDDDDDNANDNSDDDNLNDNSDDDNDNADDDDDNVNDNSDDDDDNANDNSDDDDNLNDNSDDDDNLNDNADDDDDNVNDNSDDAIMGDAANGAALFGANCSGCHAADGSGGFGPNIQGKSDDDILEHAVNGDDGHVMFDLTDGEVLDIEAYLDTF